MKRAYPLLAGAVLLLGNAAIARADDLDEVIDYLVKIRQTERVEAAAAAEKATTAAKTPNNEKAAASTSSAGLETNEAIPILMPVNLQIPADNVQQKKTRL